MFLQYKNITADLFKYSCTHLGLIITVGMHKSNIFGPNSIISVNIWCSERDVVCNYFDNAETRNVSCFPLCVVQTFLFKHNKFQLYEK